jgi:hypothetical protein
MKKFTVLLTAVSLNALPQEQYPQRAQEGHLSEHPMYNPAFGDKGRQQGTHNKRRNMDFRNNNRGQYNWDAANNHNVNQQRQEADSTSGASSVTGDYLYRAHEEKDIVPFLMRNAYGILDDSRYMMDKPMLGYWIRKNPELENFKILAKTNIVKRDQLVTVKKSMSKEDGDWEVTTKEIKDAVKELKRLRRFASIESMLQYVAPMPMPFGAYFEYGCFCFQGGYSANHTTPHRHGAQPVDAIDTACRYHMWAYHCAAKDFGQCNGKVIMYDWEGKLVEGLDGRMQKQIICSKYMFFLG